MPANPFHTATADIDTLSQPYAGCQLLTRQGPTKRARATDLQGMYLRPSSPARSPPTAKSHRIITILQQRKSIDGQSNGDCIDYTSLTAFAMAFPKSRHHASHMPQVHAIGTVVSAGVNNVTNKC